MGTSNFARGNSSRLFAVEIQEEWDYEDLKENLNSEFKNNKNFDTFNTLVGFVSEKNSNRNFEGNIILNITTKDKEYKLLGGNFYLKFGIIIRNGYYSGVNLDWQCDVITPIEEFEHDEEIIIDGYSYDISDNQASIYNERLNNWKEKEINKYVEIIEQILSEHSTELNVVAQFSNGETIYEKA